jgi:hypothetical protein
MKYLRMTGLLVVAAAVLAFAASASATTVTTTTGGAAATPTIHLVNEGGHIKLTNPIINIECAVTAQGAVTVHGAGKQVEGQLATLSFTNCTSSWHVTPTNNGSFFINFTGGHNGLIGSHGAAIDATRMGVTCVYESNNSKLGTITGGNPATVKVEGTLPLNEFLSSPLCGGGAATWSGNLVTTSALYVAA